MTRIRTATVLIMWWACLLFVIVAMVRAASGEAQTSARVLLPALTGVGLAVSATLATLDGRNRR